MALTFSHGSYLLDSVIEEFKTKNIQYAIARNYFGYPDRITGDVDIIVEPCNNSNCLQITRAIALSQGWKPYIYYMSRQSSHIGLVYESEKDRFVLVFEYFSGGVWKGVKYLPAIKILSNSSQYKKYRIPSSSHEAILTLLHHLLYSGKVYDKYRESIINNIHKSRLEFRENLIFVVGRKHAKIMEGYLLERDWERIEKYGAVIRKSVLLRYLPRHPLRFLTDVTCGQIDLLKKPYGIVINIYSYSKKTSNQFADQLIGLAMRWHIFIPPHKIKLTKNDTNYKKKAKTVVKNGGIVIFISTNGEELKFEKIPLLKLKFNKEIVFISVGEDEKKLKANNNVINKVWYYFLTHYSNI